MRTKEVRFSYLCLTFVEEDLNQNCMICLNKRFVFNGAKKSWYHHIGVEHDLWLYPLYIKYL